MNAKQIENGDFEAGLSSWSHDPNTYPIGTVGQPIGYKGNGAANLGTFDQTGSSISQTVDTEPGGSYRLSFAMAANAVGAIGKTASLEVSLQTVGIAPPFLQQRFSVTSVGFPDRALGFELKQIDINIPSDATSVRITFRDISPAGGTGVDLMLDSVSLQLTSAGSPPAFTSQPEDLISPSGENITFTSTAIGTLPLYYQWYKNGETIVGANSSNLTISGVAQVSAGSYWLLASNAWGNATSRVASLSLDFTANLIRNGSFESGLTSWERDTSVTEILAGINGNKSANLGTFDKPNSFIQQAFPIEGCAAYEVSFAAAANAVTVIGKTSVVEVAILRTNGTVIARETFENVSAGLPSGSKGFKKFKFTFQAPAAREENARVRFKDVSPNGGRAVDTMIDAVRVTNLGPSSLPVTIPEGADNIDVEPGSNLFALPSRYQEVFATRNFTNGPIAIKGIRFRPDSSLGRTAVGTLSRLVIRLSTTQKVPGDLSLRYEDNHGANSVTVYDGSWAFSTSYQGPEDGPKAFDLEITFENPFYYFPTAGNVLFDVTHYGINAECLVVDGTTNSSHVQRISSYGYPLSEWALSMDAESTVMQLLTCPIVELEPKVVQTPSSLVLIRGQTANFSVKAISETQLAYQWLFEGVALEGQTNASLLITNVTKSMQGHYSVKIANTFATIQTSPVTLEVNNPPVSLSVVSTSVASDGGQTVYIDAVANGDEAGFAFSLHYDSNLLEFGGLQTSHDDFDLMTLVNTNQSMAGLIGIAIAKQPGETFKAGTNHIAALRFKARTILAATSTKLSFASGPIVAETVNDRAEVLPTLYNDGLIFITFHGLEGDVADSNSASNPLTLSDWVKAGRLVAKLEHISPQIYQRLDCAPKVTKGDGEIDLRDWVQTGRYVAAVDPITAVGGPTDDSPRPEIRPATPLELQSLDSTMITIASPTFERGIIAITIHMKSTGQENAVGFSLRYPSGGMRLLGHTTSPGSPENLTLILNSQASAEGRIGITAALPPLTQFTAGEHALVTLEFSSVEEASAVGSIEFTDKPIVRQVVSIDAASLANTFSNSEVPVGTTEARLALHRHPKGLVLIVPDTSSEMKIQWSPTIGDVSWTDLDSPMGRIGSTYFVVLGTTESGRFFRLIR